MASPPTHLRLHRDEPAAADADAPATYKFPTAMATARRTLVAGRVAGSAVSGYPSGVIGRVNVRSTDDLIGDVEATLDRMQGQIDDLREDCDAAFKFPVQWDEGPRAA